jgi:hypothetical protein
VGTPSAAPQPWRALGAAVLSLAGFISILTGGVVDQLGPSFAETFGAPAPPTYAGHVLGFWVSYVVAWLLLNGAVLVFARSLRPPRPDSVLFELLGPVFVFATGMSLFAASEFWGLASALVGLGPGMLCGAILALRAHRTARHTAPVGSR